MSTQAQARVRLLRHFTSTVRELRPELSLALRHPDLPHAALHGGVVLSGDLDHPEGGWASFDIAYWVLGTTPDDCDRYFDLVVEVWRGQGLAMREAGPPVVRSAWADAPDGHCLSLRRSVNGYLSLSGSTPRFPRNSAAGEPMPTWIG